MTPINPFRFDRLPTEKTFCNRTAEVRRLADAIGGGENVLVHGPRRMGKSACLHRAARVAARRHNAICFVTDLSRYPSLASVAEALLRDAQPALSSFGAKTATWLASMVKGMVLRPVAKASLSSAQAGGPDVEFELGVEVRSQGPEAHSTALLEVLDALELLARKHERKVAIMLDEFTFLEKFGPQNISWQVRAAIQRHQNLTYILAGSAAHLVEQMHGKDGPFYGMFGRLAVGPIPAAEMAAWIDAKFGEAGCHATGIGAECIRLAGERTRDIVQLARRAFDLAAGADTAEARIAEAALASLVDDCDTEFHAAWSDLSSQQQAILVAIVSGHGATLLSESTRRQHGLGLSATVSQSCRRLSRLLGPRPDFRDPVLVRRTGERSHEYAFDNPFFGHWVARAATHRSANQIR